MDCLAILVQSNGAGVEVINLISSALKQFDKRPIPTEIPDECLNEILDKQQTILMSKFEKDTRVQSITMDGVLAKRNDSGEMDSCQEYKDEKGPKEKAKYITFEKMSVQIFRQSPVKVMCGTKNPIVAEDHIFKEILPMVTWTYREK